MTVRDVIRDTMLRFDVGDDSYSNLRDVLSTLDIWHPEALDRKLPDAVTTEHVRGE